MIPTNDTTIMPLQAHRDELPHDGPPLLGGEILADAVGAQLGMPVLPDALRIGSAEDGDDVRRPDTLARRCPLSVEFLRHVSHTVRLRLPGPVSVETVDEKVSDKAFVALTIRGNS